MKLVLVPFHRLSLRKYASIEPTLPSQIECLQQTEGIEDAQGNKDRQALECLREVPETWGPAGILALRKGNGPGQDDLLETKRRVLPADDRNSGFIQSFVRPQRGLCVTT